MGTEMAGERPGVDLADADHPRGVEVGLQLTGGSPGGGHGRVLAHDEAGHLGTGGFHVLPIHPVVPDVRIGHGHDLAGVRGIGQHLLVAGERGVEHHLARRFTGPPEGSSFEDGAVLEGQDRGAGLHLAGGLHLLLRHGAGAAFASSFGLGRVTIMWFCPERSG